MARIVGLADAVAELVVDGCSVAMEGFTHLVPFAAAHEVIRQRRRDLTLIRMNPDVIYDQLIGAGCAGRLIYSWTGDPSTGLLPRIRDALRTGWPRPLQAEEHSHAGMANRYLAGATGVPFGVLRGALPGPSETVKAIQCPFTGERLLAVPAIRPDVAIVHAQRADRQGNVQVWGITGAQREAVHAAHHSLVTVEEIVDELEPVPGSTVLPGWLITMVAEVPGGSLPAQTEGYRRRDTGFYREWPAISADRERFIDWLGMIVTQPPAMERKVS
ncbi:CoA transferase subunit A [Pseudonocardiaceae bacterium YIM PH 21723]|nr:CoA transferase subunit A [Pseudonocardiaceae bacterium YIM PH 21723]